MIEAMRDVSGPNGTLVMPAFTRQYPIWQSDIPFVDEDRRVSTGALAQALISRPDAIRSEHPTHSFVAVGARARELMADHTLGCACFEPMRRLAASDAKMMLVGCIDQSPGFSTVHLAQHDLGLSQQHYIRFAFRVKIRGADREPVFVSLPEAPGCSRGFSRFYKDYEADGNKHRGFIGMADSMLVGANRALQTEMSILAKNPTYPLCERETCVRCRILCGYNLSGAPRSLWLNLVRRGPAIVKHFARGGTANEILQGKLR